MVSAWRMADIYLGLLKCMWVLLGQGLIAVADELSWGGWRSRSGRCGAG
jgi:hypothetical protein